MLYPLPASSLLSCLYPQGRGKSTDHIRLCWPWWRTDDAFKAVHFLRLKTSWDLPSSPRGEVLFATFASASTDHQGWHHPSQCFPCPGAVILFSHEAGMGPQTKWVVYRTDCWQDAAPYQRFVLEYNAELESVIFNVPFHTKHMFGRKQVVVQIKLLDLLGVRLHGCGLDNLLVVWDKLVQPEAALAHFSAPLINSIASGTVGTDFSPSSI